MFYKKSNMKSYIHKPFVTHKLLQLRNILYNLGDSHIFGFGLFGRKLQLILSLIQIKKIINHRTFNNFDKNQGSNAFFGITHSK